MNIDEKEYSKNTGIRYIYSNKIWYQFLIFLFYFILFFILRVFSPININFLGEFIFQCLKLNIDINSIDNIYIEIDNTLNYSYFFLLVILLILFFLLKYKIELKWNNIKSILLLVALIIFSFLISGLLIFIPFSYMDEKTIFLYFWIINRLWIFSAFSLSYFLIRLIEKLIDIHDVNKESCFIFSFIIAVSLISFFVDLNLIWAITGLFLFFLTPTPLFLFFYEYVIKVIKKNKIKFFFITLIIGVVIGIYLQNDTIAYAAVLNIITKGGKPPKLTSFHFGSTRNTLPFNRGWFFYKSPIQNQGFLSPWWRDTLTVTGAGVGTLGLGIAATDSPRIQKHMPAAKNWAVDKMEQYSSNVGLSTKFPGR